MVHNTAWFLWIRHPVRPFLPFLRRLKPRSNKGVLPPPIPDYSARTLAYSGFALMVVTGFMEAYLPKQVLWTIPVALIWPQVLFFILRHFQQQGNFRIRKLLLYTDGLLCALVIVNLEFSLPLSLFIVIMLNTSLILVGGMRSFLYGNLSLLTGLLLFTTWAGFHLAPPAPALTTLISGLACAAYVSVAAFYAHRQATALARTQQLMREQRARSVVLSHKLTRYLSPQVWQSIFSGERDARLGTQRKKLAIFFSDMRGFTELSEELAPESLTELLNHYFNEMAEIALRHGGTIDKFVGDSILVFFGDPTTQGPKEDTLACVKMAMEMRSRMRLLRQQWQSQGVQAPLELRMGINTGFCNVGNFGAENRMDYTIIGREVNLASRLESQANPGEILISQETFALIKDQISCTPRSPIQVKGFQKPLPVYAVGHNAEAAKQVLETETGGFTLYLDVERLQPGDQAKVLASLDMALSKLGAPDLTAGADASLESKNAAVRKPARD